MAQHDMNIANQSFPSFRTDLNNALTAIQTTHSGTSLPTGAVAGQIWLDTTNATNPTLKFYDGSDSISLATINYTANTVDWLDSSITITGLSTTATGTVLTLSDTAHTTTVNLVLNNQTEIRFSELTANGSNYVGFKAPASLSADKIWTLPSADGTNGQALVTNGSGVLSFTTISTGTSWQSVQTTGFTAVSGRGYPCNTTSSAFTVTLPASPTAGDYIQIVDYAGTFATNNITLGRNGSNINGSANNRILTTNREAVTVTYVDATQGWVSTSASNYGTQSLDPTPYSIDFLVVAGGGGGGAEGGGGGAGGYRTSTQTVNAGVAITVTVGDGGTGGIYTPASHGTNGSDSSISGTGLTTITSTGGGRGGSKPMGGAGNGNRFGLSGGSGGGASRDAGSASSGGAGNTPSTSPSQGNNGGATTPSSASDGAGGGGASAVGTDGTGNAGAGGSGTASSITGSSVTRAGGGGGGASTGSAGAGGSGGGGAGSTTTGNAGTANTGGGGGGGGFPYNGASGGKGVVILSVPTANYSATTTGSPTVTTSGSNTILQFNGSGSYTT